MRAREREERERGRERASAYDTRGADKSLQSLMIPALAVHLADEAEAD